MAPFIVRLITCQMLTDFQNSFTVGIRRKFVMKLSLQIPPHLKCVTTLPREMSDDALKPATPLTSCVINVDRAWHAAPKQPRHKSGQLCCSGCSSTDGLSMLTIHDSQPAKKSHCRWVGQCRSVWLIAPLVSGVAGFDSSSSSKTDTLQIWCENCKDVIFR